jgi:prepilin-type N-terminal cleavage/methylation domain-containing protein
MRDKNGFTLVEMSIVLVIIGFIVGGVMIGNALIDRAHKQYIISDLQKFNQAFSNFNTKYLGLPGDLPNASTLFGLTGCGAGTLATCNGDGNNSIDFISPAAEDHVAWQHLILSGVLTGAWGYNAALVLGTNVATSIKPNMGYWIFNQAQIVIGAPRGGATNYMDGGIFTPDDARYFDNKIDDGQPGTGVIHVRINQSTPTVTTTCINTQYNNAAIASATYVMTDKTTSCFLIYVTSLGNQTVSYAAH